MLSYLRKAQVGPEGFTGEAAAKIPHICESIDRVKDCCASKDPRAGAKIALQYAGRQIGAPRDSCSVLLPKTGKTAGRSCMVEAFCDHDTAHCLRGAERNGFDDHE